MIEIRQLEKRFGKVLALDKVDLKVASGSFTCLLGASGCGKTTLLRILAGIESSDSGTLSVHGKDISQAQPHKRGLGMVFQNYALWPHLNVFENIAYGLRVQNWSKHDLEQRVRELAEIYELSELLLRLPAQLSGGQQQRVALARAMATRPAAILMDEPLSNLDAGLRRNLRNELRDFHRLNKATVIYVTHDQEEALLLGDQLAFMEKGKIVEVGEPKALYQNPACMETARFLGDSVFLSLEPGKTLFFRPENAEIQAVRDTRPEFELTEKKLTLSCQFLHRDFLGKYESWILNSVHGPITVMRLDHQIFQQPQPGDMVSVQVHSKYFKVFG